MHEMLDDEVEEKTNQGTLGNSEPGSTKESTIELKNEAVNGIDEENVGKAIRFWTHPSLRDISSEEKLAYLHERGISKSQIQKAWEKIAENPTNASGYSPSKQSISRNQSNLNSDSFQTRYRGFGAGFDRV